ncbi:MAG: hypothetical protein JW775_10255 [Candidatus Aminicenantes bacterium]|nr:hypothetical protein [Candidatus Aminicenantes bacterium]
MKELLAKALGIGQEPPDNRSAFTDLCGVWTESEVAEFMQSIADLETIDPGDWA